MIPTDFELSFHLQKGVGNKDIVVTDSCCQSHDSEMLS